MLGRIHRLEDLLYNPESELTRPPSPLQEEKLRRLPGYFESVLPFPENILQRDSSFDAVGEMSMINHPELAPQSQKFALINQVAQHINALPDDVSLTVLSMRAAGFLELELLHRQVKESRHDKTKYCIVDQSCLNKNIFYNDFQKNKAARTAFEKGKKEVKTFASTSDYIRNELDIDKHGAMVVMHVPALHSRLRTIPSDSMLLQGQIISEDNIKEANTVLIFCNSGDSVNPYQEINNTIDSFKGEEANLASATIKCFVENEAEPRFMRPVEYSDELYEFICGAVKGYFEEMPSEYSAMEKLNKSVKLLIECLNQAPLKGVAKSVLFDDQNVGVKELSEKAVPTSRSLLYAKLDQKTLEINQLK